MENIKNKKSKSFIILLFYGMACFLMVVPSIIYYIKNHTVLKYKYEFYFLLNNQNKIFQAAIYLIVLTLMVVGFILIIKNRKKLFKSTKKMFLYIAIISVIFVAAIPFTSSDVFYYLRNR